MFSEEEEELLGSEGTFKLRKSSLGGNWPRIFLVYPQSGVGSGVPREMVNG